MPSILNGLSSLGQGVAAFAGTAGLELQRSQLAQQQAVLADQLATTRETTLQGQQQTFQAGQQASQQAFQSGLQGSAQRFQGSQTDRELAARASEGAANRASAMDLERARIDAPSPEIKSAKQFSQLTQDQKRAYREETMLKAGLPPWMMGDDASGGAQPSAPSSDTGADTPDAAGAPPTDAAPSRPGLNDKALVKLPPTAQSLVKGMVDGRISPPSSFAASKPYWQNLIQMATTYDPTFDETTWAGRVAMRKSAASGPFAASVTAMNTAMAHAGTLVEDFDKLNNSNLGTIVNTPINAVESAFGDARQTKAEQTVNALASEARKVFASSGGGNLTELQEWQKSFPLNGSPKQQKAALAGFVELLDGRLQAMADQYNRAMGRTDEPMNLLQPKARAVYEKLTGREPTNATGYQTGAAPAGAPSATPAAPKPALKPPAIGEVQQGYTFSGGDPADPASWKAAK